MPRPTTTISDERLVALVRAGSDDAYGLIVTRYREPLTGFAAKLLGGSHADAEDVVQDAFIRGLRGLRAERPGDGAAPVALHDRPQPGVRPPPRREKRTEDPERLELVAADHRTEPYESAAAREELDQVVAEIGRLPERQRLALVKRELGGATHRELAGELGTSVAATKSLLVRARSSLAEAIAA